MVSNDKFQFNTLLKQSKMEAEKISQAAIDAFKSTFDALVGDMKIF